MARSKDVVVVGGGVVGCAIACELARRGARVAVFEIRDIGRGATHASAGVLAPFLELHQTSPVRALGARSLAMYDEFVARAVEASGTPVQYVRNGTLELASDDSMMDRLSTIAEEHAGEGIRCELLDRRAVREREPQLTEDVVGGLLIGAHGYVAAGELTSALSRAAVASGATIAAARAVRRISSDGGGNIRLETAQETILAGTVVLAAGSWSGQLELAGSERLPVRPVRGQLLYLLWTAAPLRHVLWGSRCYLVPWADGTLLVGATVEEAGFDERATVAGVYDLLDAACEMTPKAWQAAFQAVRVGLRPATPDELPVIGYSAAVPGLVYATGHFRSGVLLAPVTAALVADLVLEHKVDPALEPLLPSRFGNM